MININRKKTKEIKIGNIYLGGNNPIYIQSMCNTDTKDIKSTVNQILALEEAGCEIIRVAVLDMQSAFAIKDIKKQINIPIVADIHFDYRLALECIASGVDKIRINPGNIGDESRIKKIVDKAKERNIAIRIGVNSGSLEKNIIQMYNGVTSKGLVESALNNINILEKYNFENIIVSIKASSVPLSIESYSMLSEKIDYPIHLGITEAGTIWRGTIKSSVGIGTILSKGIGDTIRVSLTGDPIEEIYCAKEILKSLCLRKFGIEFISCPTCGRTKIDLISIAREIEDKCKHINKNITVAIMGCAVNGPGEAKEADIGIAGGIGEGVIFKKGKVLRKVKEYELVSELMKEIENL